MERTRQSRSFISAAALVALATLAQFTYPQSQAIDGQIEGVVRDRNRAAISGAVITARNSDNGAARKIASDREGVFRFLLLPPGTYRLTAEATGFKRSVRDGLTLTAGQTTVVDLDLEIGAVTEDVQVSADAPVSDAGRVALGRTINTDEVRNLPLIDLNPYHFVFLQSNVTGNRLAAPDIGFANVHANGFSRRGNFMIDGNYATDVMLGGIRMLFMSRTYIDEIHLTTRGISPEFGWTVGHVTNIVTPSGTNSFRGTAGYQFRRAGFAAARFNANRSAPQPVSDIFTATFGGPIVLDRWHFYTGFETFKWDLARASRLITISDANRAALAEEGVPISAMPTAYPAFDGFTFFIGRIDGVLNDSNRLGIRYFVTKGYREKMRAVVAPGTLGITTLQLSQDYLFNEHSIAGQLVSNRGSHFFNELRIQRSARESDSRPNEHTGLGEVTVRIANIAVFGAPLDAKANFEERPLTTIQNNLSLIRGAHSLKVGAGLARHYSFQPSRPSAVFRFQNVQSYRLASSGIERRSYIDYTDTFGDTDIETKALFLNVFVQDDWKLGRSLRLNAGIRYDVFVPPDADPTATYEPSRRFRTDRNNFGPRLGVVYSLTDGEQPFVIRASGGLYYDPPILEYYRRAKLRDGSPHTYSVTLQSSPDAPEFPDRLTSPPAGQPGALQFIEAVSPDFKTMTAFHGGLQIEKAISENFSASAAYSYSRGWHIPTSRNVNCRPTGTTLADGRPLYGTVELNPGGGNVVVRSCTNRILPQFGNVWSWESVGTAAYHAASFSLRKRLSNGYQFSISYTLARATDDAPEENIASVAQVQSDPSDRRRDRSVSLSDQKHTFVATLVARPRFSFSNTLLKNLLNNNQISLIARASDGERYNIVTNIDLNADGGLMDRPVGVPRNALKTPPFFNVDLRVSRSLKFTERYSLELFADVVNVTNTKTIVGFNITEASGAVTSITDPFTGLLRGPLPDFRTYGSTTTDSRRMQLGVKFHF